MQHNLRTFLFLTGAAVSTAALALAGSEEAALFHTDFEDGLPAGVTAFDQDEQAPNGELRFGDISTWKVIDEPDNAENKVVASASYFAKDDAVAANDWLVLPQLALPSEADQCNVFFVARSTDNRLKDGVRLLVAEADDNTALADLVKDETKWTEAFAQNKVNTTWTTIEADLKDFAGKTVFIAIVNQTDGGNMLLVDDITVGSRASVPSSELVLTTDEVTTTGSVIVSAKLRMGILETLTSFTARVTANGESYTEEFTDANYQARQTYTFSLKQPLEVEDNETTEYTLELLVGDEVFALAKGSVKSEVAPLPSKFAEDFDGASTTELQFFDLDQLKPNSELNFGNESNWKVISDPNNAANKVAASAAYFENSDEAANDWLVLPRRTLSKDAADCNLFFSARSTSQRSRDNVKVYVSEAKAELSTFVGDKTRWTEVKSVTKVATTWQTVETDLSAYAGKNVWIAIVHDNDSGELLLIDDITLGSRSDVSVATVKLTTPQTTQQAEVTITANVTMGILETLTSLKARVTTGETSWTEDVTGINYEPRKTYELTLKKPLTGEEGTTVAYKLELLVGDKVIATDESSVRFQANDRKYVYYEDFENGMPKGFTLADLDGLTPKANLNFPSNIAWVIWDDPDDAENKVACSVSYYEEKGQSNDWMVTPAIELPDDADRCQLYWRSRSFVEKYRDNYTVFVSESTDKAAKDLIKAGDESAWTLVKRVVSDDNGPTWSAFSADLSKFKGKKVYVAFVNMTSDGWVCYIDDIVVGPATSVPQAQLRSKSERYASGSLTLEGVLKAGILTTVKDVSMRVSANGSSFTEQLNGVTVAPNALYTYKLSKKLTSSAIGPCTYTLELLDKEDNVIATTTDKVTFISDLKSPRNIVAEGLISRGQDGGYGPRIIEGYAKMEAKYGDRFIGFQTHGANLAADFMTLMDGNKADAYLDYLNKDFNLRYGRDVLVNRLSSGDAYDDIEKLYTSQTSTLTRGVAKIDAECTDDSLLVDIRAVFGMDLATENYAYEIFVTEDGIKSTQWNIYSGGIFGEFLTYSGLDLETPVTYNDVTRKRYATSKMTFDKQTVANDTVRIHYGVKLPSGIDYTGTLKVSLLIVDKNTGEVINATRCTPTISGDKETMAVESMLASTEGRMEIFTLSGEKVADERYSQGRSARLQEGKHGIYIIKMTSNDGKVKSFKVRQ